MSRKTTLLLAGFVALCTLLGSGFGAYANEDPPGPGEVQGPELWGVVVIDCGSEQVATLRVKKIENCVVSTQAYTQSWTGGCPTQGAGAVMYWKIDPLTLFGEQGTPIIMGVKNWKQEQGIDVYSFDAKIMFWIDPNQ